MCFLLKHQQNTKHDQNIFAISIVNDWSFCKFVILSIIEGNKLDEEVQIWKFTYRIFDI